MEFSIAAMKRMFKKQTDKRVSRKSAELLNDELEERGREIAELADRISSDKGRATVRVEDIKEAVRRLQ